MNTPFKFDSNSIACDNNWSLVEQYVPLRIDESDRVLAQAMNSLSTEERGNIMEEIHGVSNPIEESPDFILEKLAEFDSELLSIRKNEAYELALKKKRGFVEDISFRLMFLRCNRFDASAASKRMMEYLKLKETYFGQHKIAKDIGFLDLSEEDIISLKSGVIQVLSEKDRSGRAVIVVFPSMWNGDHPESMLRATYFLEMSLVQDPDVQRRGIVYIYYNTDPDRSGLSNCNDTTVISLARTHKASMPVRYAAYHICLRDRSGYQSIGHAISKTEDIVKGISHYGSDKECLRRLRGFGIPVLFFPMNTEGTMDLSTQEEWVQQKKKESATSASNREASLVALDTNIAPISVVQYPKQSDETVSSGSAAGVEEQGSLESSEVMKSSSVAIARAAQLAPKSDVQPIITDVVFGRGRWFQYFPGNISFREFLDERAAEYNKASRSDKIDMTKSIVTELKGSGRRFLKLEKDEGGDGVWVEVGNKEIYKKVSQCYRTVRKKDKTGAT